MKASMKKFNFRAKLFGDVDTFTLSEIKDIIAQNARKRLVENWWFTSQRVHNATISAINFYNELSDQETYHDIMQEILVSHAQYLYSPVHWITKKHLLLVDLFMNQAANKRLEVTLLDIDRAPSFGSGILAGIMVSGKERHGKK